MKKITAAIIVFACTIALFSCKKDSENISSGSNSLQTGLTSGVWNISYFYADSSDQTTQYSDYKFVFDVNNHLAFANSLMTVNGTWSTDGSGTTEVLNLNLDAATGNQQSLKVAGAWQVAAQSDEQVALKRTIIDNPGVEYLNLQKLKR